MELNKAIEVVRNIDTTDIHCKECVLEEKDKCITDLFGYSCQRIAIDTVLEELDNRIPRKDIEDIYNELKKVYEDELNRLGMTMKGSALDVLEYILNKYKE